MARTKHLARIASQVAKPDGLVVVDADTELEFLHRLPVEKLGVDSLCVEAIVLSCESSPASETALTCVYAGG